MLFQSLISLFSQSFSISISNFSISVWVYFVFFTGWDLILRTRRHPLTFVSHDVLQWLCSLGYVMQSCMVSRSELCLSKAGCWDFPYFRVVLWTLGPMWVLRDFCSDSFCEGCVCLCCSTEWKENCCCWLSNKGPYCEGPVHLNNYFAAVRLLFKSDG